MYPEKYYTLMRIAESSVTAKAVYGEVPIALPVSQKGYSEFLNYYYVDDNEQKVPVTDRNGGFTDIWTVAAKELTLYADYDRKPIGVTLDYGLEPTNAGITSNVPKYLYYGDKIDFTFPVPSSLDYDFKGWYTEESAGVQIVNEAGSYLNTETTVFKSDTSKNVRFKIEDAEGTYPYTVTFYARWEPKTFTVTFKNGEEVYDSVSVACGSTVPNLSVLPQGNEYFLYWYTTDENVPFDFSVKMPAHNLVLNSHWVNNEGKCPTCNQDINYAEAKACQELRCSNCDTLLRGAIAEHTFGEAVVKKASTCGEEGKSERVCQECGLVDEVSLPMLTHVFKFKESKPATCKQNGYVAYECVNCHARDVRYDDMIVDHVFNTSTVAPSGTKLGYDSNICTVCGTFINNYYDEKGRTFIALKTASDLQNARKDPSGNYVLMNDIDLEGAAWAPWGVLDGVAYEYEGVFNGDGKTIKNYTVTADVYGDAKSGGEALSAGFFAVLSGEVRDVTFQGNVEITSVYTTTVYVGGLAGKATEKANIVGVKVNGNVALNDVRGVSYVGGMVGALNGTVKASAVNTVTDSNKDIEANGYNYTTVGGLAGVVEKDGMIQTSTALTRFITVSAPVASIKAGGLVGENKGAIVACYARVYENMEAIAALESYAGGLIGVNSGAVMRSLSDASIYSKGADVNQSHGGYALGRNDGYGFRLGGVGSSDNLLYLFTPTQSNGYTDSAISLTNRAKVSEGVMGDLLGDNFGLFTFNTELEAYVPLEYEEYVKKIAKVISIYEDDYLGSEGDSKTFIKEFLNPLEGSVRSYRLDSNFDLAYGTFMKGEYDDYYPIHSVNYFFGDLDGGDHFLRRFKFASGSYALIRNNYGTVRNLETRFYFCEDKETEDCDVTGIVQNNKGEVQNASDDGNSRIRMKRGLQIFLGIFVLLFVLAICFFIESWNFVEGYGAGAIVSAYVISIIHIAAVAGAFLLWFLLGSTRLSVYMAITSAAIGLWPLLHSWYYVVDDSEAAAIIPAIFHVLAGLGGIAVAVFALIL